MSFLDTEALRECNMPDFGLKDQSLGMMQPDTFVPFGVGPLPPQEASGPYDDFMLYGLKEESGSPGGSSYSSESSHANAIHPQDSKRAKKPLSELERMKHNIAEHSRRLRLGEKFMDLREKVGCKKLDR